MAGVERYLTWFDIVRFRVQRPSTTSGVTVGVKSGLISSIKTMRCDTSYGEESSYKVRASSHFDQLSIHTVVVKPPRRMPCTHSPIRTRAILIAARLAVKVGTCLILSSAAPCVVRQRRLPSSSRDATRANALHSEEGTTERGFCGHVAEAKWVCQF